MGVIMEKKELAILLFVNKGYIYALESFLVNLRETNSDLYDNIIIYHSDLSDHDCKQLQLIDSKILFQNYSFEEFTNEHGEISGQKGVDFVKRYTHLPLAKYKIFEQLRNYKRILSLDVDMLIRGSLSELLEIKGIAWRDAVVKFWPKITKYISADEFMKFDNSFTIDELNEWKEPNGGLIYCSDDGVDVQRALDLGKNFIRELCGKFNSSVDELAIAYIANAMEIEITSLDYNIYNTPPAKYSHNTKVIHFLMRDKPWESDLIQTVFPEWMENFKKAEKITAFNCFDRIEEHEAVLREVIVQREWLGVLAGGYLEIPKNCTFNYKLNDTSIRFEYTDKIRYVIRMDLMLKRFKLILKLDGIERGVIEKFKGIEQ